MASPLRSRSCVYLLYTGYHFVLSALLTSWQESAELLWLCFWYPAASSPLLCDSNIIKYIFRLCKAHQIQIKRGFFLKPQIFYNERFYLLKLCAKSWRVHTRGYWLIRRWITEDLSVWYATVTLSCNFYLNLKQFPSVKSERNCRKSAHLFQRSPSALLSW